MTDDFIASFALTAKKDDFFEVSLKRETQEPSDLGKQVQDYVSA